MCVGLVSFGVRRFVCAAPPTLASKSSIRCLNINPPTPDSHFCFFPRTSHRAGELWSRAREGLWNVLSHDGPGTFFGAMLSLVPARLRDSPIMVANLTSRRRPAARRSDKYTHLLVQWLRAIRDIAPGEYHRPMLAHALLHAALINKFLRNMQIGLSDCQACLAGQVC